MPFPLPTLSADFPGAHQVTLVAHQNDGCLWLGLPEEETELSSSVETPSVRDWKHQDANIALQSGQVLQKEEEHVYEYQ